MPPQTKLSARFPFHPQKVGAEDFPDQACGPCPKPQDRWLAYAPSPPLSQSARTSGPCSPPGCVRARPQAPGSSTKGPLCAGSAPGPWPGCPAAARAGSRCLRLGAAGGASGAGWPRKQILRYPVSCNVSRVRWGVEGRGHGRDDRAGRWGRRGAAARCGGAIGAPVACPTAQDWQAWVMSGRPSS